MTGDCTIDCARVENLDDILRIYYKNSLKILGISRIEKILEYDRKTIRAQLQVPRPTT